MSAGYDFEWKVLPRFAVTILRHSGLASTVSSTFQQRALRRCICKVGHPQMVISPDCTLQTHFIPLPAPFSVPYSPTYNPSMIKRHSGTGSCTAQRIDNFLSHGEQLDSSGFVSASSSGEPGRRIRPGRL